MVGGRWNKMHAVSIVVDVPCLPMAEDRYLQLLRAEGYGSCLSIK